MFKCVIKFRVANTNNFSRALQIKNKILPKEDIMHSNNISQ